MSKNFNYPKSSCECYNISNQDFTLDNKGIPSKLGVTNCKIPTYLNYFNEKSFKTNIQPTIPSLPYKNTDPYKQYSAYNSQAITEKYAKDFQAVKCDLPCGRTLIPGQDPSLYVSEDPRLVDAPRAMMLNLNVPPIDSTVRLDKIYDSNLTNYGKKYSTYSDINTGQIVYYTDKTNEEPYFVPNFVSSASIDSVMYVDPMSSMKPHYYRTPLTVRDNILSDKDKFTYNLSWMDDTTEFREDLMSRQMAKMNQNRWSNRWS